MKHIHVVRNNGESSCYCKGLNLFHSTEEGGSQLPVNSAPMDLTPYSDFWICVHACYHTHTLTKYERGGGEKSRNKLIEKH